MKYFYDIYLVILTLFALLYIINPIIGIEASIISMIIMLIITNDMKYIMPNLLFIIYNYNNGFKVDELPLFLIINILIIIITPISFIFW